MSAAVAAAAAAALVNQNTRHRKTIATPDTGNTFFHRCEEGRYDSQKRRDWNTFRQYLRSNRPTLAVSRCSGAHVIEFLRYIDQFGKIKVHKNGCSLVDRTHGDYQTSCACPPRQASASLDGLIGRLFAAYEENGGLPGKNPFGERSVQLYLVEVRQSQVKGRGIVKP